MSQINSPRPGSASLDDAQVREARPFFWIVMIVLAVMYFLAVTQSTALKEPVRLVLFTVLMLVHAALHWNSPRVVGNLRASVTYLGVQGALAFVLPLIGETEYLVLGLTLALVGEAVGILWNVLYATVAIVVLLALSVLDLFLLSRTSDLPAWALGAVPTTFFVVVYVVLYSRQAQARAHAQELLDELETAHRQLSEYAVRVQDLTVANERQRMARELHDTLAQGLAGLILQLEAANTHLANGKSERAQSILQQAMTRARATLADARHAIDGLRAGQDFETAVREEVAHFTDATGIPCALEVALGSPIPEAARETALRTITEGLTNIARHSQAQQAWVSVQNKNGELVVELRDDGRGFDPKETQPGHYGLLGIRERARLASGTVELASAPGKGTTLKLCLPSGAGTP